MKKHHDITDLHFTDDSMVLTVDGEERRFRLIDISPVLARASGSERETYEISPSGYGIHWPLLDEDISIDGLLGIVHARGTKRRTA
ncbi:MAG: DUF2442 domain-containing protein [Nitrospirales bacterium]|nr:DUF2442 domain-containing protein [Nitrospirales bacterium]